MASENYFAHLTECQTERREEGRERVKREVAVRGEGEMRRRAGQRK